MGEEYRVIAASGTLRDGFEASMTLGHNWTTGGVAVETQFTGAHLLHLATAACVLNDLHREAASRRVALTGVRVTASGGFDPVTWASTGVRYSVEVASSAPADDVDDLIAAVDAVAEIPRALRTGMVVQRA